MEVIDQVVYYRPNVTQFYDMNGLTAAFRDTSITVKTETYQGKDVYYNLTHFNTLTTLLGRSFRQAYFKQT